VLGLGDYSVPSFPGPSHRELEALEQFTFSLLHTLRGFGIAVGSGDASQDGQSKTRTQVLLRLRQGKQGLKRCLVAPIGHKRTILSQYDDNLLTIGADEFGNT
jgi:hypothetical protein